MSKRNILIVTYDWSPRNSIAVHRPYAWAKYWSGLGHDITVLTAEKCLYDEPLDMIMPEIEGVTVVEVPYRAALNKAQRTPNRMTIKKMVLEFLKKHSRLVQRLFGLNLDVRDAWATKAKNVAIKLHQASRFDVVVSTYGPRACHFIGSEVKARDPSIFWVADYRDMWSICHDSVLVGRRRIKEHRLEKETLDSSDLITTVSGPLVKDLEKFLNRKVHLAFNGYDVEGEVVEKRVNESRVTGKDNFKLVYTGMIYPGWRDPTPLFSAINELTQEQKIYSGQIRVDFYGKRQPGLQEIVSSLNAETYVTIHGHVTRDRALEEQENADLLLIMESGDERAKGVLTGKIFEYMVSGRPVISLGSTHDSAIGRLIYETGIGAVCEQDVSKIKNCLLKLVLGNSSTFYQPRLEKIRNYSRERQAGMLIDLINEGLD